MPRGDGFQGEYRFADGEDDSEDLGYGGGGAGGGGGGSRKYDDDDEDEGGWATHRETNDLWDSTDDLDDEDEVGEATEAVPVEGEEEEEDAFGRAPTRGAGGSRRASGAAGAGA